jgi:chemotaxis protein MotB
MKKKHGKEPNHERWLLSYADFITLLMVFFIVLYSSSNLDANKYKAITDSFQVALGAGGGSIIDNGIDPDSSSLGLYPEQSEKNEGDSGKDSAGGNSNSQGEKASIESVKGELDKYLKETGLQGSVTTEINERGLVISLKDTILFDSGKTDIKPEAEQRLIEIGKIINKLGNYIRIEGHTDNLPIHNSEYSSNWELSAIRATIVTELLISKAKIVPQKISAVGYGEYRPIADNKTSEGKAKNRRVNIAIMDSRFSGAEQN